MSSTAVLGFIKDIISNNLKAVQDRLKATPAQISPNATFADPKEQGLTYRLIHKAVEVGNQAIVEALLSAGADCNAPDSRGRTPLHWCATSGSGALSIAELLLRQPGIDIHATASSTSATPVHEAAAAGNSALLQLLLQHGADPQGAASGYTALHAACMGSCTTPHAATPAQAILTSQPLQDPAYTVASSTPKQDPAPTSGPAQSKPGQLKPPGAAGKPAQAQQPKLAPKPPAPSAPKRAGPAVPQRTALAAAARATTGPARTSGAACAKAPGTATKAPAAAGAAAGTAGSGSGARASTPTGAAAAAVEPHGVRSAAAPPSPRSISTDVLDVLLQGAAGVGLLACQDFEGFTPLMRLVQRGHRAEAEMLLARGDCNIHAQAAGTGDTALHIACSSSCPDMQLVSALVSAGADATLARHSDGSTPLLLAAKAGGQVGLALAKALLLGSNSSRKSLAQHQQQQDGTPSGTLWCRLDDEAASAPDSSSSSSSCGGVDAANAAGETAVGVAAAAVLASVAVADGQGAGAQPRGAVAAATVAGQAAAQQELLVLLLDQHPKVPQQLASALLEQGLREKLPDSLTAKVVASMADMPALEAAVAAAPAVQRLEFDSLLAAKMFKTAIAVLSKSRGRRPCEDVDAGGNTLLHRAVSGTEDQPEYVTALVEAEVPVNAENKEHDTALHIAARQGHLEACRALVVAGADLLRRNGKNRIPGSQLKLCEPIKAYLQQAEEEFRAAKEEQRHAVWDDKMRATQTQSAFGIRVT